MRAWKRFAVALVPWLLLGTSEVGLARMGTTKDKAPPDDLLLCRELKQTERALYNSPHHSGLQPPWFEEFSPQVLEFQKWHSRQFNPYMFSDDDIKESTSAEMLDVAKQIAAIRLIAMCLYNRLYGDFFFGNLNGMVLETLDEGLFPWYSYVFSKPVQPSANPPQTRSKQLEHCYQEAVIRLGKFGEGADAEALRQQILHGAFEWLHHKKTGSHKFTYLREYNCLARTPRLKPKHKLHKPLNNELLDKLFPEFSKPVYIQISPAEQPEPPREPASKRKLLSQFSDPSDAAPPLKRPRREEFLDSSDVTGQPPLVQRQKTNFSDQISSNGAQGRRQSLPAALSSSQPRQKAEMRRNSAPAILYRDTEVSSWSLLLAGIGAIFGFGLP